MGGHYMPPPLQTVWFSDPPPVRVLNHSSMPSDSSSEDLQVSTYLKMHRTPTIQWDPTAAAWNGRHSLANYIDTRVTVFSTFISDTRSRLDFWCVFSRWFRIWRQICDFRKSWGRASRSKFLFFVIFCIFYSQKTVKHYVMKMNKIL